MKIIPDPPRPAQCRAREILISRNKWQSRLDSCPEKKTWRADMTRTQTKSQDEISEEMVDSMTIIKHGTDLANICMGTYS